LVIGLITALGGNGDGRASDGGQPSSRTTVITGPSGPSGAPGTSSSSTTRPPSSSKPSAPPTTGTTTTGQTVPPDGNGEPAKSVPVRVLNNSTIKGLAAKAKNDLMSDGWNVTSTGNYSAGIIPTTTVYYRPGTEEEAAARAIGAAFGMRVEARFDGIKDATAGVIVIVTNDYGDKGSDGKNES
jgi:hypothetical protein